MQTISKRRAAQQFNQAMLEFLETEHGFAAPDDFNLRAKDEFVFSLKDDFDACPERQFRVLDDKGVRISPGILRIDADATRPEWWGEHVRLGIHIGEDATGAPLATAALPKSEVLRLIEKLCLWIAVIAGAGGFDKRIRQPSEIHKIRSALSAARAMHVALVLHGIASETPQPTTGIKG